MGRRFKCLDKSRHRGRPKTQKEMYAILEKFKDGDWDDEQRSTVAKVYMRIIGQLPAGDESKHRLVVSAPEPIYWWSLRLSL